MSIKYVKYRHILAFMYLYYAFYLRLTEGNAGYHALIATFIMLYLLWDINSIMQIRRQR